MSKCIICGNELLTGDVHWQNGMCNNCWSQTYKTSTTGEFVNKESSELLVDLLNKKYQEIASLNQQIAELKAENAQLHQQLKDNTKQVCEKIREWGNKHFNWVGDGTGYDGQDYNEMIGFNNAITKLLELLDQIENEKKESN